MYRKSTFYVCLALAFFSISLASCKKFEGSQTIPAYIHIESIEMDPLLDYYTYGAPTSKITDAWVYVDDQIIGCYELPTTFPILKHGPHKVSIYGGICTNGIGASRAPYPFYRPMIYQDLNLVEDSIINLSPALSYYPIAEGANIAWMEDFENTNSLLPSATSDTGIYRVTGSEAWHSVNSFYSGKVELPPDSLDFTIVTANEFDSVFRNTNGVYCMLEMDYNCNDTFFVGVQYYNSYQMTQLPLVKVTPTDKTHDKPERWNKIYINLSRIMNENTSATGFKVYFTSDLTTNTDIYYGYIYHPINERRYYYFDNLKVIYRNL